jgi:hypothetical protein
MNTPCKSNYETANKRYGVTISVSMIRSST